MDEWLHNLPVWWMAFVVFAIAYLAAGGIFVIIMALAKGSFSDLSPRERIRENPVQGFCVVRLADFFAM